MHWHENANTRSLPWKQEKDPYKIWLSEIILQQTRAAQGLPYYLKFTEAFPTVKELAKAKDEKVFRLWQGLGYYNRCKNMLATARHIANDLKGIFPHTYGGLLELKGIGPYTAAAIASFAYGLPHAVVDGNVYRVLARYFGMETPTDSTEGKKLFTALADEVLDRTDSAAYNQAIMDLGATVCTPALPMCEECPLRKNCVAYKETTISLLPVKSKKLQVKKRYFHYILLQDRDKVWLRKRSGRDIWENLYEPYLIESNRTLTPQKLQKDEKYLALKLNGNKLKYDGEDRQKLTHQLIESRFYSLKMPEKPPFPKDGKWVKINDLKKYAFPKTVLSFLEKKLYF